MVLEVGMAPTIRIQISERLPSNRGGMRVYCSKGRDRVGLLGTTIDGKNKKGAPLRLTNSISLIFQASTHTPC